MGGPSESVVDGSGAQAKDLPSVDRLLRQPGAAALVAEHGHTLVAGEARALVDALRARALAGALPRAELLPDFAHGAGAALPQHPQQRQLRLGRFGDLGFFHKNGPIIRKGS